jgi:RNA polymerase sigma-70 factor (ECF subfamily)
MERIWQVRSRYRPERGPVEAWLIAVGFNAIRDEVRRARRDQVITEIDGVEILSVDHEGFTAELEAVQGAFRRLPSRDAELLSMRYASDLSNEDIATILGKRPGTVAVALHRALKRLRAELETRDD